MVGDSVGTGFLHPTDVRVVILRGIHRYDAAMFGVDSGHAL